MYIREISGIELYYFKNLSSFKNITHFVSSRIDGFSAGGYQGLNMGFNSGDEYYTVLKNRQKLSDAIGYSLENFVFADQCHTSNIAIIEESDTGLGAKDNKSGIKSTDGLITGHAGIFITIQVADCVPLLLYDSKNEVVAAIHAGWKGTLAQIASNAISNMKVVFGTEPSDVYAGIGPSIGSCCYEVGSDVYVEYQKSGIKASDVIWSSNQKEKYFFDLWMENKNQLIASGVDPKKIETASVCTKCNSDKFYSVRAEGSKTGRFVAGIMINKNPAV